MLKLSRMIFTFMLVCMLFGTADFGFANKIISTDQAKEIALGHAKVNAEEVYFTKVRIYISGEVKKYELNFSLKTQDPPTKYEYEIDAVSGKINLHNQITRL